MEAQLASHKSAAGEAKPQSAAEREESERVALLLYDAWTSRRRSFLAIWSELGDRMELTEKKFYAEVEYEKDEAAGADYKLGAEHVRTIKKAQLKAQQAASRPGPA